MSNKIKGIGASDGIALAKAYVLKEEPIVISNHQTKDPEQEIELMKKALERAKTDLKNLQQLALEKLGGEKAAVFEAHAQILDDPMMSDEIITLIREKKYNAARAIKEESDKFAATFDSMDDEYFRERAADIRDVTDRWLRYVLDLLVIDLATIKEEVIIVANDLTPSQTAQLNPTFVKGFACNVGGRTSHAAIMARSLEIPAVLGLKTITESVKQGAMIALDGNSGDVEIEPADASLWDKKAKNYLQMKKELNTYKDKTTVSKDGNDKMLLEGNIGTPKDVEGVIANGGEGIGLFRSEFLYMDNDHFPTEDEQFEEYKKVLENMGDKMVVIRTLDIGGDKKLSYFQFPAEMNPFLGYRAIRFSLDRKDVFKNQIRALLRASAYGKLGIMFPMIATIDEFKAAKDFTLEQKKLLEKEGIKVGDNIEIGMMVEIPAAAMNATNFAKYADFFSVGTNDLIQYSMAADRMSEKVSYLYQPLNPSILNLLKLTIDGAHKHGKWAGMCGEMAGDAKAIPLLMGLGLDAFSMSASSIPLARSIIAKLTIKETQELTKKALELETAEQVEALVDNLLASK
ncbi:phosphoenolpyruvate--protein phosphotransferase [Spiroplasma endosymbiont of Labia minor]|uniref:phosphoenolpyruvate--protein phosphotransferase n=1 Tax=Spiroplasma endosymbiont of Labia minor TaxID=3066305 RepID=UPI0030D121A4